MSLSTPPALRTLTPPAKFSPPAANCPLCPRLAAFRDENRARLPAHFNAPVPSFGDPDAPFIVVGLAPGLNGANKTGRPFTGDYAGDLLYATLRKFGFANGTYRSRPDDGLTLVGCRIANAVRCVPPQNKPTGPEARTCRPFLVEELTAAPAPRVIFALGQVAHVNILSALDLRRAAYRFGHAAVHHLPGGQTLIDSYHCSRYNTNTGRLTQAMFHDAFARAKAAVDALPA